MVTVLPQFQKRVHCHRNHSGADRTPRRMVLASGCPRLLLRQLSINSSKSKQWSQLSKPSPVSSLIGAAASVNKPSRLNRFNILGRNPTKPCKQHRKMRPPPRIRRQVHAPLHQLAPDNGFARAMLWMSGPDCLPFATRATQPSCIEVSPKLAKEHQVVYSLHTTLHMVALLSNR